MDQISLGAIDLVIVVIYIVFIIAFALKNSKNDSSQSYFLAGRNSNWIVVGLSLFAASVSSSTLIGHSGEAFISGIAVFNYNWVSIIVMVFFALFFLPFYIKNKIYTMPEFLERRYDKRSRIYFSLITILGNVFLDSAAALYTGALIIKLIFPAAEIFWIIVGMAAVAGSYTIIGGLSSAIKADLIQSIILFIGSTILALYAFDSIGGWDEFYNRFHEGVWLKLTRSIDDPTVPWPGLIVGIPILGFYFWCNNQVMVQRVLSARSIDHGRKGVLLVGFMYLMTLFIFISPGLIARGINLYGAENLPNYIISGLELKEQFNINTDEVYPRLIVKLLPVGLIGIMLAVIVSALTSTLSATLNSVSTLFTMDFYTMIDPKAENKKLVKVGQITALISLIISVFWAPLIVKFDSLVSYYQEVVSYLAPPIVGAFFIGLFWKRANSKGGFWGLMSGLVIALGIMSYKYIFGFELSIHFLLLAPIVMLVSGIVNVAISLSSPPPAIEKIETNTWNKELWIKETNELKQLPWYKNYRNLAMLLVIACFGMYLLFF